ncbi:MAG TPA: hypothetical protein VEK08_24370, partial [Planctomycetota bacterium]|nr:hypothetical protein [Planctomycetota bacterium]
MGARSHTQKPKARHACPGPQAWGKGNRGVQSKEFLHAKGGRPNDTNNPYLRGKKMQPPGITGKERAADLIDSALLAYNGGRLREACLLFTEKMLAPHATVGMSLSGAMTPAGLGCSSIIP